MLNLVLDQTLLRNPAISLSRVNLYHGFPCYDRLYRYQRDSRSKEGRTWIHRGF